MKENKTDKIEIRLTQKEKADLLLKAHIHTNGNVSKWVRYCLKNYKNVPKKIYKYQNL